MENMICETENSLNLQCLLIFSFLIFSSVFPGKVNSDAIAPSIKNISAFSSDGTPSYSGDRTPTGPTSGGTLIIIEGDGFLSYSEVHIGGERVKGVVKVYDNEGRQVTGDEIGTKIEFYTPPVKKAGRVEIQVLNLGHSRGSNKWPFEYFYLPPVIEYISPIGGKLQGGTSIEITGSELRDGAKVRIGEKEVPGVVKDEGKKITAKTPPGSEAGHQDVTIINPDGKESNTLENSFVYADPPTIITIDPKGGFIGGGTKITIMGFNFLSEVEERIGEKVRILIGERKAEIVEIGDRKIIVKSPFGEIGAQDVIVQNILNPDELADIRKGGFVYAFPPQIKKVTIPPTGVNPNGGTQIDITGTYFPAQENLQVLIGGKEATEVSVGGSGTKITAKAPSGSGEVYVKVSNLINPEELSHTSEAAFTYNVQLKALEIEPDSGILDGGTLITITGSGFIEPIRIKIGSKDAQSIDWNSSKQIEAKTPKSAQDGIVNVLIINGDGQRDFSLKFTYNPPNPIPIITKIAPEEGRLEGGDRITISGKNFMYEPIVEIGGNRAADVEFISSNEIKATTPRGREGTYDVIVTNPDGQPTEKPGRYTYNPQPEIISISPEIGSPSGGTKIMISGENFKSVNSVMVGGKSVKFEEMNSSMITAVTPTGDTGKSMDVVVTNRDSQEAKLEGRFTPVRLVVSKIEPESGSEVGGKQITISGDGFIEGAIVTIGNKPAEDIKVESRRRITAKTPQNPPGLKDVIVINPNEQEPTPEDGKGEGKFTYYAGFPSDTNIRVYNYPNPINAGQSTTFRYNSKKDAGIVEIKIFNMAGELITSLSDGDRDGLIPWNDIDIPPGLYPYVFILNGKVEQGQLLLVKRMK